MSKRVINSFLLFRVDDGMLLAQTENCCMGLIDVKHVKTW